MPKVSKAQQASVNRYIQKAYDRINLTVPKGMRDEIKQRAEEYQESANAYITRLIKEDLSRG